jgi:hypothetical protein
VTARKPKPLGSTIEVPEGATVIRPGTTEADALTITGGAYVLDVPGVHIIDGAEQPVGDAPEVEPK